MIFCGCVVAIALGMSIWLDERDNSTSKAVNAMVRRCRPRTDLKIERRRWSM